MTHLQVVNKALIKLGEPPLKDMEGTDDTTTAVAAFYESCWDDVLRTHDWTDLLVIEPYTGEELSEPVRGKSYLYDIDENFVNIHDVTNVYGKSVLDSTFRIGRELYSEYSELVISFISNYGIIPVDIYDFDIDVVIPNYIIECVALKLAYEIAMLVSNNADMQAIMQSRYNVALRNAIRIQARPVKGEDFWGSRYGNS